MRHRYLKNVATLVLDTDKCKGCGRCMEVCPHGVFAMKEGKAEILNRDWCMECGACEKNCPFGALEVNAGVGCAAAIIKGFLTGTEATCGCSDEGSAGKSGGCC
ncbi:MAG: 4Fe-4S binding protein [Clostridiales bacterium]|nr:4Fe-4S binding protein [Clostridiales bacterium]